MQKKLLAVAVSGALGAMAAPAAFAQNATVSVYGALYAEYASISHGMRNATDSYQRVDQLQNPGSAIGFRGEEKISGNLSAWFQCETTMDWRGSNNTNANTGAQGGGLCNRDSAFGLKGAFGNIFAGNWGTPFKRVTNDQTGANDTGVYGVARILYGGSSTYGMSPPSMNINNTTLSTASGTVSNTVTQTPVSPGAWRRRQSNLIAYDTPNFSGFQGMAAITVGNSATGATAAQLKSRLWSVGGSYSNGPLALGLAYEKHNDFYGTNTGCTTNVVTGGLATSVAQTTTANSCNGSDEHAWALTGSYTFANNLKLGAQYSQQTAQTSLTSNQRVNTYHVGIDWMISGPHGVRAAYSHAGDVTGSGTLGAALATGNGGQPIGVGMGVLRPVANTGGGTSVSQWQIRYVYAMSKRTEFTAGYSRLNNSVNANYEMGGVSTTVLPGTDAHAVAISLSHKF